jgi:molybdopterin-guanine dinucleotide biosynthesis protein A
VEPADAVILAAGRLRPQEAALAGVELKALLKVGDTTPLRRIVKAMQASHAAGRVIVVGPRELRSAVPDADEWVDERSNGEENVLAGLRASHTGRAIVSASDLPFVEGAHVDDFAARVPSGADFAYPVYERDEFLAAFPGGRARFARVGGSHWTGGSVCLMDVAAALRNASLIGRGFRARKSQLAMASLLGMDVLARYVLGNLRLADVERRLSDLSGGSIAVVRGAHPALAMDCDGIADIAYVRARTMAEQAREER